MLHCSIHAFLRDNEQTCGSISKIQLQITIARRDLSQRESVEPKQRRMGRILVRCTEQDEIRHGSISDAAAAAGTAQPPTMRHLASSPSVATMDCLRFQPAKRVTLLQSLSVAIRRLAARPPAACMVQFSAGADPESALSYQKSTTIKFLGFDVISTIVIFLDQ